MAELLPKVFLDRDDDVGKVTARLAKLPVGTIHLIVPRESALGASPEHFAALKREADAADREIVVESVDDHMLELAGLAGFRAVNPFFRIRERAVADIVPRAAKVLNVPRRESTPRRHAPVRAKKIERVEEKAAEKIPETPTAAPPPPPAISFTERGEADAAHRALWAERPAAHRPKRRGRKLALALIVLVAVLGGGVAAAAVVLPRATVTLTMKKTTAPVNERVEVSSKAAAIAFTAEGVAVPGELLSARRNLELSFPASGKEQVTTRATGKLIVYNAFSSKPQTLVRTTRFESLNKKIFRVEKQVVVPGAKIENNRIVPSSIEVTVVADEPGESYNLPASSGWRIPSFKENFPEKYDGFYAETKDGMKGGFVGERAKPTADDLAAARGKVRAALEDALKSQLIVLLSEKLKMFPNSAKFTVVKEEVRPSENASTFSLFMEAEMRALVYDEGLVEEALTMKAKRGLAEDLAVRDFEVSYNVESVTILEGRAIFLATGKVVFTEPFDAESFRASIAGSGEQDLKATVFALPGLESARITLKPFWVKSVPRDPDKVEVVVE